MNVTLTRNQAKSATIEMRIQGMLLTQLEIVGETYEKNLACPSCCCRPCLSGHLVMGSYNGLVGANEQVTGQWSQVENQLQRHNDHSQPCEYG